MISASWFIYWANVVDNARSVVGPLTVVSVVAAIISLVVFIIISFFAKTDDADCIKIRPFAKNVLAWCLLVSAATASSYTFTPNKNTMYAIAAAQVGEQVINSETVRGLTSDATKALQQWIKKQLDPKANN